MRRDHKKVFLISNKNMTHKENTGKTILIERVIAAPIDLVFDVYTDEKHILHWNRASEDWTTPFAESDPVVGGKFRVGYGSPDGKNDFVFEGTYDVVDRPHQLNYHIAGDARPVAINFSSEGEGKTKVSLELTLETENAEELQRDGWSAILARLDGYIGTLS